MRKTMFVAAMAVSITGIAQDCLKDVGEKVNKGKYQEAKEKLDKCMTDPKVAADAGAYYYKGKIETYYTQTDTTGSLSYDAPQQAFEAYKKALEIDPKNKYMTLDQNVGLFQLYETHYNRGVKSYNNKDYANAYKSLRRAVEVQDYIREKNFSINNYAPAALDTQLVQLTGSAAYAAKMEDAAIPYFERLLTARLSAPEYRDLYVATIQHYQKKGDEANTTKYVNLGRELYKDDDFWLGVEIGDVGNDHASRIKRYEELLQKYPNSGPLSLDYTAEVFNNTYVWDTKPADYAARQAKLQTSLDKTLALNPNSALANYIASQHYYTQVFDLEDARRAVVGNAPAAAAKRKEFNTQIDKKYDEMAAASQKAFDLYAAMPELKAQDKSQYRKVTDQLIDYYTRKKMTDKVTEYQQKKATIK